MRLENSFAVPSSSDRVWALFDDVPRIVPCMPGAELTETLGENAWKVTMHVKLGPISLQFAVNVERERVDEAAGTVVLSAKARELKGRGGARAMITLSLAPAPNGTSVSIVTELDLQGAVAQYSRGVVPDVAAQLTERFAECLANTLKQDGSDGGGLTPNPAEMKPIGGFSLGVTAFSRRLRRLFRRT